MTSLLPKHDKGLDDMSQRSVCEFNHDYADAIKREPEIFIEALRRALASGDSRLWDDLRSFGLVRIVQRHHSNDGKVVLPWKEYPLP